MKKNGLIILFSFFIVMGINAQEPRKYAFTHYGRPDGLASNEVWTTVQDKSGFIWIGTANGLQRFDGLRYLTFRNNKNDKNSIPGNNVSQMVIDKANRMWLHFGSNEVGIFDTKTFRFTQIPVKASNELFPTYQKKLIIDHDGNIFLLVLHHEILRFDEFQLAFIPDRSFPSAEELVVLDMIQDPFTKKYWMGSGKGLVIFDKAKKTVSYAGHNVANEPAVEKMAGLKFQGKLLIDKSHRLWFDIWGPGFPYIYLYDIKTQDFIFREKGLQPVVKGYYEIAGFTQQSNGDVWVNGLGVLGKYLEEEKAIQIVYNGYESEQSIDYQRVSSLMEDREQNIWVSTNNNGLYRFNPSQQFFTNIHHIHRLAGIPSNGSVMAFTYMKDGTVLMGAWGEGTYHYDANFKMIPLNIKGLNEKFNPSAWSMSLSGDSNTIWIGAQPGIIAIDQEKRSSVYYTPAILEDKTVRQAVEDKNGNLWIGTQSIGVFKWTFKKGEPRSEKDITPYKNIPRCQVLKLMQDKEGLMWIGTAGNGTYVVDPNTDKILMHFGTKEAPGRVLPDGVAAMLQYDDTTIVIASSGLHFYSTKQKKITRTINLPEGMAGYISSAERDKNGYIWVSMSSGLNRVNPKSGIFVHFDRYDGISNDWFIIAASCVLPDGRMLFGADNQFVVFDPAKVQLNKKAPDVKITDFTLMNKPLLVDSLLKRDRIELSPKDNSIVIAFSGLMYSANYLIRYKLEGLEKEWKTAGGSNEVVYSYLPPGTYTFLARSEDAEGNPAPNITKLIIKVRPPFWKTWWFLGFIIFAATAVLFYLDKLRMQKLRAMESVRTRIATSLTEDMSSSLTNINISSELAKTKISTDTQRTREYIAQISDTSNRMVQSMYDMVWSIDPKNDTMADTIDRMKSFAVEVESGENINIDFDIDKQVEKLALDMERRYELLCIYKEAVINASRHSNGRHIKISLRYSNRRLMMMIIDDGKGFNMDDAAMLGRGMSDMRRRAAAINSILYIESEINTGTVVKLEMPV